MANEYINDDEFREYIGGSTTSLPGVVAAACTAASRRVDAICGRRFYKDTAATARTFTTSDTYHVWVDDISSVTDLAVATDDARDGLYSTAWTIATDFILEPANQVSSGLPWAYTALRAVGTRILPVPSYAFDPYPVRVTARWGWPAVPAEVRQATLVVAEALYKRKDAPFGVTGVDQFGPVRVREDPLVMELLSPYILHSVAAA